MLQHFELIKEYAKLDPSLKDANVSTPVHWMQNEITFGTIIFFGALFVLGLARGGLRI